MKITCISDLHGYYPELPGGDLLIIAGDLFDTQNDRDLIEFDLWLTLQKYKKKIIVAGNHDNLIYQQEERFQRIIELSHESSKAVYLRDSRTDFMGLKIWGSPWTSQFINQNKKFMAFTTNYEFQLSDHFNKIPADTDILITHTPPYGILDECTHARVGSESLRQIVLSRDRMPNLKMHFFGHIHAWGGCVLETPLTKFVNCAVMNDVYEPVNKIVNIEL